MRLGSNAIGCALVAALALSAGCGEIGEEGIAVDGGAYEVEPQADGGSVLYRLKRCYKHRKSMWTRRRTALRRRPTGRSLRLRSVPRGARVRLVDRNGDGRVCQTKRRRGQPNWFFSARYGRKRGWIRKDKLRATPPRQNPVPGYRVTTPFGTRGSWAAGYHTGDDYAAPIGARVVATRPGRVKTARRNPDGPYGRHVVIQTGGVRHLYAHLSRVFVSRGQRVQQGTRLGKVGQSGRTSGPHLHYEERVYPYGYYDHRRPRFNR